MHINETKVSLENKEGRFISNEKDHNYIHDDGIDGGVHPHARDVGRRADEI